MPGRKCPGVDPGLRVGVGWSSSEQNGRGQGCDGQSDSRSDLHGHDVQPQAMDTIFVSLLTP